MRVLTRSTSLIRTRTSSVVVRTVSHSLSSSRCHAIKAMRPESVVKLKVLRQGAVRVVAVKVSARPAEKAAVNALAYEGRVQELLYRRGQEAEKYWKENFAGVMGKELKTSASTTSN